MHTVTQREVAPERLYSPFVVPTCIDELRGPEAGTIVLPRRLVWNGDQTFDLEDPNELRFAYERVLTEGSPTDIAHWINADLLRSVWTVLRVDDILRRHWVAWLPELLSDV